MQWVIAAALNRSRTVLLVLMGLLVAGAIAYGAIPKEANPDVNIPILYVSTSLDGVSPEDAERLMIRPMEEELRSVEGIKEMRGIAHEGGGSVILEFEAGFDAEQALIDVREAVDTAQVDLPGEADEPTVHEVNVGLFPVLLVTLSGDIPEATLVRLARSLRDRIEGVPQVLDATIAGDREEVVEIVIDPLLIESYGLQSADLGTLFSRSNRLVAAGALDTGEGRFPVKVPGLFETVDDIFSMPVTTNGDAVVRFSDVARIRSTFKDPEGYARVDGQRAISLEFSKRSGEKIIETIEQVRLAVAEESRFWPDTVKVGFAQDQSIEIRDRLADLQNNVISAILLVMIVIVGALGVRSAGFVGIAIPGSFLTGILLLAMMGLTVNIVVLFALILAVGMLVDGAIVVTEYADRRLAEGADRREAYRQAATRMSWPIIASTATTLAAFMPLLFWPGVVGEFMKFLPITLIATLTASLAMALIFLPVLGTLFGRKRPRQPVHAAADGAEPHRFEPHQFGPITRSYAGLLGACLARPGLVVGLAFASLVGVWMTYATHGKGVEFFPEVEPEVALVLVHARGNLSVDEEDALVREVEDRILTLEGEFDQVYTRTGFIDRTSGEDVAEDVIGQISLEFSDWRQRRPATDILAEVRRMTADMAGITVETRIPEAGPPVGKPVALEVSSPFPDLIAPEVAKIRAFVDQIDGLVDIEDSRPLPGIQWEIEVDRAQAAKFGVDLSMVGENVRMVTNGLTIGTYRPDHSDDEIDIIIRYPEAWRHLEQLNHVRIETADGSIPIANFVERLPKPAVGTLNRIDGARVITIKADVAPGVLADSIVQQLRAWLPTAGIDPRVTIRFAGEDEEAQAAQAFLGKAFGAALVIMLIILVTQFNSLYSALLILTAVVMSTVGVLIGLLITDRPFGIVMTGIGVIALAGIVVNNNIVLIDTYDRLRRVADSARDAVLLTGAQRLRPVLLTTVTTILGLMPMVLQTNIDFVTRQVTVGAPSTQWWVDLATAIAFGLSFATILTLLVTPCALMLKANLDAGAARLLGWWRFRTAGRAQEDVAAGPSTRQAAE